MKSFALKIDLLTGEEYYEVYLRGQRILVEPLLNKGSSFSEEERRSLKLTGLLRNAIGTLEQQVQRSLENYNQKSTDLERYIYLLALQDRNETLFYRLLYENLKEMLPIVYTPTVGLACQKMSHIMRQYRGIYLSPDNICHIDEIFSNVSRPDLSLIVVTDGERILGLGDLGSDGMGIPVGKVNLYVAAGGIHPSCCLPICLDVGTNNQQLLQDPMYLGWRQPRLRDEDYYQFIERFVLGVRRNFPNVLLQWEDFGKHHAFNLLDRYRERIPSFNDDIQGTGATALAALMTAMKIKQSTFSEQRFAVVGVGQAGVGILRNIQTMLQEEGLSDEEIRRRIFAIDMPGLLLEDSPSLDDNQRPFAQKRETISGWKLDSPDNITLADVVRNAKTTVLIGVTGQSGLFDNKIVNLMAKNTERPVIMALSNPTAKCECTPEIVARATQGRGFLTTGSPFDPYPYNGNIIHTSQCNNLYIFPGVGLGALITKTLKVTDKMFLSASKALSDMVTQEERNLGLLLPPMDNIRKVSFEVAFAVAKEAREAGLGRLLDDEQLAKLIAKAQWEPHYYTYRPGTLLGTNGYRID